MTRDKAFTLIGILLALFLGALDQTIVATALPEIVRDLEGLSRYAWVATAYLLASTVLVPIYGKLADMYSKKAIELTSVGLFLSGSFLCGIAGEFGPLPLLGDGMNQLIAFRALQGLGGAGLFSMAFIVIADLFPPRERGKYQGLVGATFGVASILGPWIGGLLTDYGGGIVPGVEGWRWVFYVNVPFGALAVWFLLTRMPPLPPTADREPLDYLSAGFMVLGLVPLILGLQLDKTLFPWAGATTLSLFAAAALFLTLFTVRSVRSSNPILAMELFRNRVFSTSNAALFFLGAVFLGTVIFLPLFMVQVLGVSATRAGVSLIPLSIGAVAGSVASGQLASRLGRYRVLMLAGGVVLALGIYLLSSMPSDISYARVTLYMVIVGLGVGPSLPLYTLAIQNAVKLERVGQATSASQFFRQIGGTVGAAVLGTVLATTLASSFGDVGAGPATGFDASAFSGELRSGGDVAILIGDAFEARYDAIAAAIESGDATSVDAALAGLPLPAAAQAPVRSAARAALDSEAAASAFLAQLRSRLQSTADAAVAQVESALREGTATAISRIFAVLLVATGIGWILTWFVPALELRQTQDLDPPPAAAPDSA